MEDENAQASIEGGGPESRSPATVAQLCSHDIPAEGGGRAIRCSRVYLVN